MTSVPSWLRAVVASLLIAINTALHATPLLMLALLKALIPLQGFRRVASRWLVSIGESWIAINSAMIQHIGGTTIHVSGLEELRNNGWYLVISNHQSWVDIPILQSVLNRRIPFLRFFLKSELIWVPVLGLAWWALDFPFMKRYSKEQIERKPELRGKDMEATRAACEKYRELPVSVMNFVEGTRYTPSKHQKQASPYQHLLKPRAGGVALVVESMGTMLEAVVDVTVSYPQGRPSVADLVSGRVRDVRVDVRRIEIPPNLIGGNYESDPAFRERVQTWIGELWADKDVRMQLMQHSAGNPPR